MAPPRALMESVSENLRSFLEPNGPDPTRPPKKFFRDALSACSARAPGGLPMGRNLPDRGTKFLSRLDRLEGNRNRPSDLDDGHKAAAARASCDSRGNMAMALPSPRSW